LREQGVPYIIISGYSTPPDAEPALRDAPLLAKPVSNVLLIRALVALVNGSPLARDMLG
jgi:hypothetical protein